MMAIASTSSISCSSAYRAWLVRVPTASTVPSPGAIDTAPLIAPVAATRLLVERMSRFASWGLLLFYGAGHPTILALGGLAYTFGLRHAFDADHIAAIDNTTRKLLQDGRKPVGVGFFFSLGHSSVVFVIAAALGLAVKWIVDGVAGDGGQLRSVGGMLGTVVSGGFLVLIGVLNLVILLDIVRVYRRLQAGGYDDQSLELDLSAGGVMSRIFGRLFRVIRHSWQMYPIGFLFGLGFDTASEVAILAISAGAAAKGPPFGAVIALPLIFAAGISLMDTAHGVFMAQAYSL